MKKLEGGYVLRLAMKKDLQALVALENICFNYDQMSRRSFRWMLTKAHSIIQVIEHKSEIVGYGLVLINKGTSLARLYSIALHPKHQGRGLSKPLLQSLELQSLDEGCAYLRLEVKANNKPAIALYEKLGYLQFNSKEDYYQDGEKALCFEKRIALHPKARGLKIPFYHQNTEFTCGPACLMMAMKSLDKATPMNFSHEIDIWREATTIFMTSGHGGCGPRGLALAAHRRGYATEVFLSKSGPLFMDTVRSLKKKRVLELVSNDFEKKCRDKKIKIHHTGLTLKDIKEYIKNGAVPIILISTYHFDTKKVPHWVVITNIDEHFVYINDPDTIDEKKNIKPDKKVEKMNIPIAIGQFDKSSQFGKDRLRAAVIISK
jgi:ribosomal protein S18 acetylase RimI-like enzyme